MANFDRVRDRLPSVYRPADDDAAGEPLALDPARVLELNGEPVSPGALAGTSGTVTVTLPAPAVIRQVRLAPGTVTGSLATLELYRFANGSPHQLPGAAGRVRRDVAVVAEHFREERFALRLKRPGLLSRVLWAVAAVLDELERDAAAVMQAHWLDFADHGRFSPYLFRSRELASEPPPGAGDPDVTLFPYINDLARIGSLVALLPWREPIAHREPVEAYRQRIRRIVDLYREGLGTVAAIRAMVEAQLPVDLTQPPGLQDRPFTVEETAPLVVSAASAASRGPPTGRVGPLMRWKVKSSGLEPAPHALLIEGVEPEPGVIDATERPLVELFADGGRRIRLGIAYDGSLAAGQTLRLRPAHRSWIGRDDGLFAAASTPSDDLPADPTASGPWAPVMDSPAGPIRAIAQTEDRTLWVAAGEPDSALHRFDGEEWNEVLSGLPTVHCLAQYGAELLIGTEGGLLRLPLFRPESEPPAASPDPTLGGGPAVHVLFRAADDAWLVGTGEGLVRLTAAGAVEPFGLADEDGTGTAVFALHEDRAGRLHVGTELGVFRYQPGLEHWYWFRGGASSDQHPDWQRFFPDRPEGERGFPADADVFLPAVHAVLRGPDESLWLGTARGIARYHARSVGGLTYMTLLEAFPELTTSPVFEIREDERGLIWFATGGGVFRFDGRDWWQIQDRELVRLPARASPPGGRGEPRRWRFHRQLDRWELFDPGTTPDWTPFTGEALAAVAAAARRVAWTDGVAAELGSWDGERFTADPTAEIAPLRMRYKPNETEIVEGGLPAVPRLPPGESEWRYLALEPETVPEPSGRPAWTVEGRLLPPPDRGAVLEGRYSAAAASELSPLTPLDLSDYDDAAFAFNPAARVRSTWEAKRPLTVLVRLRTMADGERIEAAILDRIWQGIEQVRPAGIRAMLAVDEAVVRGR